jgi:hypothetical protein
MLGLLWTWRQIVVSQTEAKSQVQPPREGTNQGACSLIWLPTDFTSGWHIVCYRKEIIKKSPWWGRQQGFRHLLTQYSDLLVERGLHVKFFFPHLYLRWCVEVIKVEFTSQLRYMKTKEAGKEEVC